MILTAKQVLNMFWYNTAPIDPERIANNVNIRVYREKLDDTLSGYIQKNPKNNEVEIYVNSNHSINRQRFTIAHELGHYFSMEEFNERIEDNADLVTSDMILKFRKDNCTDHQEIYANQFASELLMPKEAIDYLLKTKKAKTIGELASFLQVSISAMNIRLINLGYIDA